MKVTSRTITLKGKVALTVPHKGPKRTTGAAYWKGWRIGKQLFDNDPGRNQSP